MPRRVVAREEAGAARRAVAGAGVTGGEHQALLREPVEVGRLHEIAALIRDVFPAEIVGVDEDDVGARRRRGGGGEDEEREEEQGEDFHRRRQGLLFLRAATEILRSHAPAVFLDGTGWTG